MVSVWYRFGDLSGKRFPAARSQRRRVTVHVVRYIWKQNKIVYVCTQAQYASRGCTLNCTFLCIKVYTPSLEETVLLAAITLKGGGGGGDRG